MASIPRPKIRTSDHSPPQLVPILLLVPKSLLHGIPITATAQDLHHAQYLQPYNIPHGANDSPPTPHDELVMKSYMHVGWRLLKHITTILMPTLKTRITGP